ncbi:hypothetical protein V8E54_013295 [Elaphomyces granulatus]
MAVLPLLIFISSSLAAPTSTTQSTVDQTSTRNVAITAPVRPHSTSLPHGRFSGTANEMGALNNSVVGTGIVAPLPVDPEATKYPSDGQLHEPQPAPYVPAGGLETNGTIPVYKAESDWDYESLALALYQEWIELDLFHNGLDRFSADDFIAAGLGAEERFLIRYMADQELGHLTMISNILGPQAPQQCVYNYPYRTVREFFDFCQKLTRFGEAGVYGYLLHLNSREAAQLLLQAITTEARQQLIFRQFDGVFPMPEWFQVGIPQSWAWTLLAPHISYCPGNQTRLAWQNFPALWVLNQPNPARQNGSAGFNETIEAGTNTLNSTVASSDACAPNSTDTLNDCRLAITQNRIIPLSYPGRRVELAWESPGKLVGPNNSYITSSQAGSPKYVAWVTQLNVTYSPLQVSNSTFGSTIQPNFTTYTGDPAVNGTMFIAITDDDLQLSPFNISFINPHVVAGPALYQAG